MFNYLGKVVLDRKDFLNQIISDFDIANIVALIGPRQCGKTTLANAYAQIYANLHHEVHRFDLESG